MLVMTREPGSAIVLSRGRVATCLITVLELDEQRERVLLSISTSKTGLIGDSTVKKLELSEGQRAEIGNDMTVTFYNYRPGKARIGVDVPPDMFVHRQEIFEQILNESGDDSSDHGSAGSGVPSTPRPKPPTLNAAADEPKPTEDQSS